MLKNWLVILVVVPFLGIFLAYTKANIYSFWLGFLLCLATELSILLVYCFIKLQKAYRDSRNIRLESRSLDFQKDYPMPALSVGKEIYLNKFTEEARLTNKKESVVEPKLHAEIEDIQLDKMPYKQKIQSYLQQIRNQYHCLNHFNQALISFGNRMMLIADKSFLFKGSFHFSLDQKCFVHQHFQGELQQDEKRALFKELKIALKKPKDPSETKVGEELKNIVLPTWKSVLGSFSKLGVEFREMEGIKQSNRQFLEMIHKKIMQDYQILQKEISLSVLTISEIKQNLEDLRRQHQKLQKYETYSQGNGNDNIEIIYWVKKQYFDFTNLVLRIKQNQKNYKLHTQKLIYYQAKLASFYQKQQHKYDQILHTRSYAFLDAYRITLEESLKVIREAFSEEGYTYQQDIGPPKVKEPVKTKNINQIIATEMQYQEEYFQRVDFYLVKIEQFQTHLEEMDIFLNNFRSVFGEMKANLQLDKKHTYIITDKDGHKERKALLLDSLFKILTHQTGRIYKITHHLENINKTVISGNKASLIELSQRIRRLCEKAREITRNLDVREGPLKEKYRQARQQLNHIYRSIEQSITGAKEAQRLFQLHSNRVKKILLSSVTLFASNQKKCVMSYIDKDTTFKNILNQSDMEDMNEIDLTNQEQPGQTLQLGLENVNNLETGFLFCQEYRMLINRFGFVAYTEWSKSQLFRQTISKEIYISLNEQINEYFSEIVVQDFEASGQPPQIIWAKELKSEEGEFIIDFNVSFRGKVLIKISTKINFVTSIPVEFELWIEEFYAIIRLCFIHNEIGSSWISFVGEPSAKITVRPKIGSLNINMTSVAGLLQNFILSKLKQSIYPIKKKITIPLYKKDQAYQLIQKRYESMAL